jgi:hypothetical protein
VDKLSELHKVILAGCADDTVGLWEVISIVKWNLVETNREHCIDAQVVKKETLRVLGDLLRAELIVAGHPAEENNWESWSLSPDVSLERIASEWDALGHDPTPGDVVWFISSIEGDRALAEGVERNTT